MSTQRSTAPSHSHRPHKKKTKKKSSSATTSAKRARLIRMAHLHNLNYLPQPPPDLLSMDNATNLEAVLQADVQSTVEDEALTEKSATVTVISESNCEMSAPNYPLDELQAFAGKLRNEKLARKQNVCDTTDTKWMTIPVPHKYQDVQDNIKHEPGHSSTSLRRVTDPIYKLPCHQSNDVIKEKLDQTCDASDTVTPQIQSFDSNSNGFNINAPEFLLKPIRLNYIQPMGSVPKIVHDPLIKSVLLRQRIIEQVKIKTKKDTVESVPSSQLTDDLLENVGGHSQEIEGIPESYSNPTPIPYHEEGSFAMRTELLNQSTPVVLPRKFDDEFNIFQPDLETQGKENSDQQSAQKTVQSIVTQPPDASFSIQIGETDSYSNPGSTNATISKLALLGLTFNSRRNIGKVQ